MQELWIIDRKTGKKEEERIYGKKALSLFYGEGFFSKILFTLLPFLALSFFSRIFAFWHRRRTSARKITPFIQKFSIDASEFEKRVEDFSSFGDFFVRKLKKEARPIVSEKKAAILPADGRYRFFPSISSADGFYVKGQKFSLKEFLQDKELAQEYEEGSMVIVRLAPVDYHRFHFPIDCVLALPKKINGFLYSVNPMALKKNIDIFSENKRVLTSLSSESFGKVLQVEVGATNVGSIQQTFSPGKFYSRGDEKGYFALGGSAIVLLFLPGSIRFADDLLRLSQQEFEIKAHFGELLGYAQREENDGA